MCSYLYIYIDISMYIQVYVYLYTYIRTHITLYHICNHQVPLKQQNLRTILGVAQKKGTKKTEASSKAVSGHREAQSTW